MYFAYREYGPFITQNNFPQKQTTSESTSLHSPHERLGWSLNKNKKVPHKFENNFYVTYTTDAEGYRVTPSRAASEKTIYIFGDSFTFGHGVEDYEAFPSVIASVWLDDRIRIINAGVMGYGITQMYIHFLSIEHKLKEGDIVIFAPISKDLLRSYKDFAVPAQYLFSGQPSHKRIDYYPYFEDGQIKKGKLDTTKNRIKALLFHAPLTGNVSRKIFRWYIGPVDYNDAKEMFSLVENKVITKGADFKLFFLPQVKDLVRGKYKYDVSIFEHENIWEYFPSEKTAKNMIGFPDDGHWNCHGHEIAAYAIVKTLIEDNTISQSYLRRSIDSMPKLCENKN